MKNFLAQLNVRLLIIHFIAYWLFIYGFDTLGSLYDFKFLYNTNALMLSSIAKERFNSDILIINLFGTSGLVIAYIISWQLSVKKGWFWANAVIIFLLAFLLKSHDYLAWSSMKSIFLAPGQIIFDNSMIGVIINGLVMIALGCLLLLKKQIIDFIDRGVKRVDKDVARKATRMAAIKKK
jgi:hypothetical protein